eukprot:c10134_g1_i1 orf=212-544(+)
MKAHFIKSENKPNRQVPTSSNWARKVALMTKTSEFLTDPFANQARKAKKRVFLKRPTWQIEQEMQIREDPPGKSGRKWLRREVPSSEGTEKRAHMQGERGWDSKSIQLWV